MRVHTHDQLLDLLDEIVAGSARGDRTRTQAAEFWTELLTRDGHPLAADRPDENLLDWHDHGLLGDLAGARVLDIGCGNGRNSRWFAEQHASVEGIDISAPLLDLVQDRMPPSVTLREADILRDSPPDRQFEVVYDAGCFHHVAPHRRATYLNRVLPLIAPGGVFGIVTFASEAEPLASDAVVITSGDNGGGSSFTVKELREIFAALEPIEAGRRSVQAEHSQERCIDGPELRAIQPAGEFTQPDLWINHGQLLNHDSGLHAVDLDLRPK